LIIADTDVLIDYLNDFPPISAQVLAIRRAEHLQTTVVTCFEILSGARGSAGERARRLVAALPIIALSQESAERAAVIHQRLEERGFVIGMADSLIAGIALTHSLPLLTRNRRHFEQVEGLELVPIAEGR
jgi:predicted nucleic acid-binding protein